MRQRLVLCFLVAMVHIPIVFSTEKTRIHESIKTGEKCKKSDIVINQANTKPLPSGIPTFRVQITNLCTTNCPIWNIHLNCGWFSSATLILPNIFKRLKYDDCLVNGGAPLPHGQTIAFSYATTSLFPLSVASISC